MSVEESVKREKAALCSDTVTAGLTGSRLHLQ